MQRRKGPEIHPFSTSHNHMKTSMILLSLFLGSAILETGLAYLTRRDWTPAKLEVDESEYYDMSHKLMSGNYDMNPRRTIGFVVLLAAVRSVVGDRLFSIQLGASILFSFVAPLTYLLARREMGSRRAGLLAAWGVVFWPPFVWYGATLYSETAALPFFTALLLAIPARGSNAIRARRWLGAGALLGLCMHIRPMYLLYSPFAALIAYWRGPRGPRGLVGCLALAAGCLAVVLPWSIAASIHEGRFVLLSTIGGEVFAGSLNPELIRIEREGSAFVTTPAMRSTWVGPGKWLGANETGLLSRDELALPYSEKGKALSKHALEWARQNPGKAAYITVRKLTYMWGIYPLWNGRAQTILGNIPTLGLLCLTLRALLVYRRHLRELAICWTPALFVSVLALGSWGSWRFREPGDLGLIVLAASLPFSVEVKRYLASVQDESRAGEMESAPRPGSPGAAESQFERAERFELPLENFPGTGRK